MKIVIMDKMISAPNSSFLVHSVLSMTVVCEQKTLSKEGKACRQELDVFWN